LASDRRRALGKGGLIGLALLAGCSTPVADAPAPRTIEQAQMNPPVGSRMPTGQTDDVCKAGEMQYLVGRSRTEIPVPVDVVNRRVTCTTCPVTHDFSAYRLNILYNEQTGVIEQVRCG
jgi:hypothetical protein